MHSPAHKCTYLYMHTNTNVCVYGRTSACVYIQNSANVYNLKTLTVLLYTCVSVVLFCVFTHVHVYVNNVYVPRTRVSWVEERADTAASDEVRELAVVVWADVMLFSVVCRESMIPDTCVFRNKEIYIYICKCTCTCLHIRVWAHAMLFSVVCRGSIMPDTRLFRNKCVHIHLYTYVYIFICIHMCTCVHISGMGRCVMLFPLVWRESMKPDSCTFRGKNIYIYFCTYTRTCVRMSGAGRCHVVSLRRLLKIIGLFCRI